MSLLARARPLKAIDQSAIAAEGAYQLGGYVPIESLQRWTGSGISEHTALNILTVYQCVRVLAETFAQLPLKVYRTRDDGGKEEAKDHPLYDVLHTRVNPGMSSFVWRELLMGHVATWGNHYSEITFDLLGRPQLFPIRPDRIIAYYDADGERQYDYIDSLGKRKRMRPGSIFHVMGLSADGLSGMSPIAVMRRSLALLNSAERFGTALFDNNARPAIVMQHPKLVGKEGVERLASQMDSLRGAGNAGKTVILEEGLTVAEIGFPPEDAEFMATRLFQKREITGAFRIPPHKVGDLERATFSNIEHQSIEFIQDTMVPWLVRTEQEIARQLIAPGDDVFAEFVVDGYLRGDAKARAETNAVRWQHGTLSQNDWRRLENENPIEGGDQYWVPQNYQPFAGDDFEPASEVPPATAPLQLEAGGEEEVVEGTSTPLTVIKSAAVRCSSCNRMLAELATPPYRFTCPKCKTVTTTDA